MRRFIVASLVAAVGVAALAMPTSASTTFRNHFSVLSKEVASKRTDNGFIFKDALLDPFDTRIQVGRDLGKCAFNQKNHKVRCKVYVHLDGTIGGYGNLVVKGNFGGRRENTLLVVNGDGDFNGVVGKVTVHNQAGKYDSLHFDLVR